MKFIADFHVHSKFSRATSKNLDLESLFIAGQLKGITVIGTGDFTHPDWFREIKQKLVPAEAGLFQLREDIARNCVKDVPESCRNDIRFILVAEISNIYKKNGQTRKNHNLVFMPNLATAEKFNNRLDSIGNIKSDGRPILGLDARDLLEITLETSDEGFLIPAHIWTPWFSLLGSKSGFDSVEECFDDLTAHIFAVETGLSSDPQMNWRVKCLDGLTLISNSDAHSPMKLGREANIFNTGLSFSEIKEGMRSGGSGGFLGTFEFYPEEGKYHADGHRKCNFRSLPADTIKQNGICPVCGKPMTLGVLYRVEQLAGRPQGEKPDKYHPYHNIIPLHDILAEMYQVGPNTKKVNQVYQHLLTQIGPELDILYNTPVAILRKSGLPLFAESIERVRTQKINVLPGFDGEFGKIQIFKPREREALLGQKTLFQGSAVVPKSTIQKRITPDSKKDHFNRLNKTDPAISIEKTDTKYNLNLLQRRAIDHEDGPLLIVAGPGTGKTLTITHRIAHLIKKKKALSKEILALTFTNKAAGEMVQRLKKLLTDEKKIPWATTFHAFCLNVLMEQNQDILIIDDNERKFYINEARRQVEQSGVKISLSNNLLAENIIQIKQTLQTADDFSIGSGLDSQAGLKHVYRVYQDLLQMQNLCDYDDLIRDVVWKLEKDTALREHYRDRYRFIFIDEYQDINHGQYRIVQTLSHTGNNICAIGDPDQSIYGFRGSDVRYFNRFLKDYPEAAIIQLEQNYRSTQNILNASQQVIQKIESRDEEQRLFSKISSIKKIDIIECSTEKSEAVAISKRIESMVGGIGFYSVDFGKVDDAASTVDRSFSDFAVLFRTRRQGEMIADMFLKAGIPYQLATKDETASNSGVMALVSFLKIIEEKGSYVDLVRILDYTGSGMRKKTLNIWKEWAYKNHDTAEKALQDAHGVQIPGLSREGQMKLIEFSKIIFSMQHKCSGRPVQEIIKYILNNSTINQKQSNQPDAQEQLQKFIHRASRYNGHTHALLKEVVLQSDTDIYDDKAEKVTLMTMHASKGLEFPVVFIAGCEDGYIPLIRETDDIDTLEEERRLFYVAMTRAEEKLYFFHAATRMIYGKKVKRNVSPFLKDIEGRLKQMSQERRRRPKKEIQQQLSLF